MKALRTPDARFEGLVDYRFAANYLTVDDFEGGRLRMHYLDEGSRDAAPILAMHGEPTWSYLYRHMIPIWVGAGHRVIAPDLVGFGRSDKPTERSDYTYQRHVDWMRSVVEQLDLQEVTLFGQDWGDSSDCGCWLTCQRGLRGLLFPTQHCQRVTSRWVQRLKVGVRIHKPFQSFAAVALFRAAPRPNSAGWKRRPMTPLFQTPTILPVRGSSRCWCRQCRMILRPRRTGRLGVA